MKIDKRFNVKLKTNVEPFDPEHKLLKGIYIKLPFGKKEAYLNELIKSELSLLNKTYRTIIGFKIVDVIKTNPVESYRGVKMTAAIITYDLPHSVFELLNPY